MLRKHLIFVRVIPSVEGVWVREACDDRSRIRPLAFLHFRLFVDDEQLAIESFEDLHEATLKQLRSLGYAE